MDQVACLKVLVMWTWADAEASSPASDAALPRQTSARRVVPVPEAAMCLPALKELCVM